MTPRTALKEARERAGFTQIELAKRLRIKRLTLLNIEVGRRDPSYAVMLRWVEALGRYGSMELFDPTYQPTRGKPPSPKRRGPGRPRGPRREAEIGGADAAA